MVATTDEAGARATSVVTNSVPPATPSGATWSVRSAQKAADAAPLRGAQTSQRLHNESIEQTSRLARRPFESAIGGARLSEMKGPVQRHPRPAPYLRPRTVRLASADSEKRRTPHLRQSSASVSGQPRDWWRVFVGRSLSGQRLAALNDPVPALSGSLDVLSHMRDRGGRQVCASRHGTGASVWLLYASCSSLEPVAAWATKRNCCSPAQRHAGCRSWRPRWITGRPADWVLLFSWVETSRLAPPVPGQTVRAHRDVRLHLRRG